ncbi:MAG: DUF885 domain-containing protein [Verrucomicrobiaceae bacterium]|nr:DUF885 domain-containing protein [Verrucomicrobiaceae bacterium]
MILRPFLFSVLCFFTLFPALAPTHADTPVEMIQSYQADASLLSRHWQVAGCSAAEMAREKKLLLDWQKRLAALDFEKLGANDRVDAILLRTSLDSSLNELARKQDERQELVAWLPFRDVIDSLADARVRGDPVVPEKAAAALAPLAARIKKLQEQIKSARDAAKQKTPGPKPAKDETKPKPADTTKAPSADKPPEKSPPAKPAAPTAKVPSAYQASRSADAVRELGSSLKQWFENYHAFMPEFAWWIKQPYEETAKALEDYGKFLREEIAGIKGKDEDPLIGKVIGAGELKRQLGYEFIPYSPEELIALAEREFAWCEGQMKEAAHSMGLGDDWKKALARVKSLHVKPGEQESLVRDEGRKAIDFVKSRRLVTVPPDCEEWWGTRMLSAQEQRSMPYAAYAGHDVIIAFASADMKNDDKLMSMRGNSRPFMHNVVPHELIPGHHLQRFMAARHRPWRDMFSTPFFVEGWALYWEMRLWDLGYHPTPEEKIGALFWRMHRCARIIVTLKFHLGQMKPEEMVKFLTDRVGHEKLGATSEVRRFIQGNYSPLYQCGYMLGGLQFLALHKEMVGTGKMTEQQFHDAVLRLGPIPVELVRASLQGQRLPPGFATQWKFDGGR